MAKNFDEDFIKSSASPVDGCGGTWCVEIKRGHDGVQVRDSKNPDAAILSFDHNEWGAFLTGAKSGEFDL